MDHGRVKLRWILNLRLKTNEEVLKTIGFIGLTICISSSLIKQFNP